MRKTRHWFRCLRICTTMVSSPMRFYLHWCLGFGHDIGDQFEHRIKHCILHYGGVLAEIRMVQDKLDPTGKNTAVAAQGLEAHLPVTIPTSTGQSILRSLGHALLILKWEIVCGELIFTYQNSYGEGWGLSPRKKKGRAKSKKKGGAGAKKERTGFGLIRSHQIFHVYVPQLLQF